MEIQLRAAKKTVIAEAMNATMGSVVQLVVLLLPGFGLSFPSASAAFASVHSSPSSEDVVNAVEKLCYIHKNL